MFICPNSFFVTVILHFVVNLYTVYSKKAPASRGCSVVFNTICLQILAVMFRNTDLTPTFYSNLDLLPDFSRTAIDHHDCYDGTHRYEYHEYLTPNQSYTRREEWQKLNQSCRPNHQQLLLVYIHYPVY